MVLSSIISGEVAIPTAKTKAGKGGALGAKSSAGKTLLAALGRARRGLVSLPPADGPLSRLGSAYALKAKAAMRGGTLVIGTAAKKTLSSPGSAAREWLAPLASQTTFVKIIKALTNGKDGGDDKKEQKASDRIEPAEVQAASGRADPTQVSQKTVAPSCPLLLQAPLTGQDNSSPAPENQGDAPDAAEMPATEAVLTGADAQANAANQPPQPTQGQAQAATKPGAAAVTQRAGPMGQSAV